MENWPEVNTSAEQAFLEGCTPFLNGNREKPRRSVAAIAISEDHENNFSKKTDHEGLHFLTVKLVITLTQPCPQTPICATPQDP